MNRLSSIVVLVICAAAVAVSAFETAPWTSDLWKPSGLLISKHETVQCFQIAIKRSEAARQSLADTFWAVSNPKHASYGQYPTLHELSAATAPDQVSIDTVTNWIRTSADTRLAEPVLTLAEPSRAWLKACMTIGQAEHIFRTRFHHLKHTTDAKARSAIRAAEHVSIPSHVTPHIDFIANLNTPIHNYHIRKQHTKMQAQIDAVTGLVSGLQSRPLRDPATAAPVLRVMYGGNELLSVGFEMYCLNGQPNNDTFASGKAPCTTPGAGAAPTQLPITGFNVKLSNNGGGPMLQFPIPFNIIEFGTDGVIRNFPQYAHFVLDIKKYTGYTIQIQTVFSMNGSAPIHSDWSDANSRPVYACDYVTPTFLKQLYGVPGSLRITNPGATQSVAEFLLQYYNPVDLQAYFQAMGIPAQTVANTVGFNNATEGSLSGGEAQLDIQVIMAMAVGAPTWFWSKKGNDNGDQEPFIEWLTDLSNTPNAPLVHSVSYADAEHSMPKEYADRMNDEFQSAGARGLTLLFASGDDGVISYEGRNDSNVCTGPARPEFPSSSPYVTSVGGTQLSSDTSPMCRNIKVRGITVGCSGEPTEVTCSSRTGGVITSGGGFSWYYPRPAYQDAVVTAYLQNPAIPKPTRANFFNPAGRGYPDIAGMAAQYLVQMGSDLVPESGTSASTPLWASLVTMWNDMRLQLGQPPLGFLNPLLYQLYASHPDVFNDITVGDNRCLVNGLPCCADGFDAGVGWDANTGLGSPKFIPLSNLMINPDQMFAFAAPQSVAPAYLSNVKDKNRVATGLAIAALVIGVLGLIGFCYLRRASGSSRSAGLLDTEAARH